MDILKDIFESKYSVMNDSTATYEKPCREDLASLISSVDIQGKKVLTVSSHGFLPIKLLEKDVAYVLGVDYSLAQTALNHIYRSTIKNLDLEEFRRVFVDTVSREERKKEFERFSKRIDQNIPKSLLRVSHEVMNLVEVFPYKKQFSYPLSTEEKQEFFSFVEDDNSYLSLRNNLNRWNILAGDLLEVMEDFPNGFFDVIYLSNIREWFNEDFNEKDKRLSRLCYDSVKEEGLVISTEIAFYDKQLKKTEESEDWLKRFQFNSKDNKDHRVIVAKKA